MPSRVVKRRRESEWLRVLEELAASGILTYRILNRHLPLHVRVDERYDAWPATLRVKDLPENRSFRVNARQIGRPWEWQAIEARKRRQRKPAGSSLPDLPDSVAEEFKRRVAAQTGPPPWDE